MAAQLDFGLTEPFDLQDEYVSGLGVVEPVDGRGDYRLIFYTEKRGERIANKALIMSMGSIPPALVMLAKAIGCDMVATCPAIRKAAH